MRETSQGQAKKTKTKQTYYTKIFKIKAIKKMIIIFCLSVIRTKNTDGTPRPDKNVSQAQHLSGTLINNCLSKKNM